MRFGFRLGIGLWVSQIFLGSAAWADVQPAETPEAKPVAEPAQTPSVSPMFVPLLSEPDLEPEPAPKARPPVTPEPSPISSANNPSSGSELDLFAVENQLEQFTVTTTKFARTLEESPSIVTVFNREELDRIGVHTLSDLLKYVPGFYEVAGPLERNFAIHGVHAANASHFVVLIDGVATNDFLFQSSAPDRYNLDVAERVEVVRGPASVIYGASALMSAINIITRDGKTGPRTSVSLRVGSDLSVRTTYSQSVQVGETGSLFLSGTYFQSGGTRFTVSADQDLLTPTLGQNIADGLQPGENLTRPRASTPVTVNRYGPGVDLLMRYSQGDRFSVRFGYNRTEFSPQRMYTQALLDRDYEQQPPRYLNDRLFVDVERNFGNSFKYGQLTVRLSGMYFSHDMMSQGISRDFYESAALQQSPVIYRWSGKDLRLRPSLEYAVKLPYHRFFKETTIYAGVDAQYNNAHSYAMSRCAVDTEQQYAPSPYVGLDAPDLYCTEQMMLNQGLNVDTLGNLTQTKQTPLAGDADEFRVGTFLQLSALFPRKIGLVLAARLDHHPAFGPRFSPRVALVAPIVWGFYGKAQFSQAFIYPALVYQVGNSLSDYAGNPDIRPQTVNTVEFLVGLAKPNVRIEASFHHNEVHDFIGFDLVRNARTGKYRFSNQGKLYVSGIDVTAQLNLWKERLRANAGFEYTIPTPSSSPGFSYTGEMDGTSKFPRYMAILALDFSPWSFLHWHNGVFFVSQVSPHFVAEQQFHGVEGTDGQVYSSRPSGDYPTQAVTWDFLLTFEGKPGMTRSVQANRVLSKLRVGFGMQNVIGQQVYRPGSVLVPYLQPNRVIYGTVQVHL